VKVARVVILAAAAGALASCGGGGGGSPSTTKPPPLPPLTTAPAPSPPANASLPWPTYGADAEQLRAVPAPGLRPPFRRVWTFHGRALLEFPPVVGYGSVFEEAFDGRLYALDPATGRVRWHYYAHRCGWSSPALADHLVFATFIGNAECHATTGGGELVAF
jgi:outer membrane protein assembly factor BamB